MFSQIWRVFFFFNSSFFPLGKSSCNCSYNYHITIVIFLCSPPLCPYYFWQNLNTGTIWITFWSIFIFEWYLLLAEGQCECGKMVSWDDQVLLWFVISNILSRKSTLFFFFFAQLVASPPFSVRTLARSLLAWVAGGPTRAHVHMLRRATQKT